MQRQSPSQEGTLLFHSQYVSNSACPKSPRSQDLWEYQLFFLGFLPYGKTSLCNLLPVSFTVLVERHTQVYTPFAAGCFQLEIICGLIYLKAALLPLPSSSTVSFISILFSPFSARPLLHLLPSLGFLPGTFVSIPHIFLPFLLTVFCWFFSNLSLPWHLSKSVSCSLYFCLLLKFFIPFSDHKMQYLATFSNSSLVLVAVTTSRNSSYTAYSSHTTWQKKKSWGMWSPGSFTLNRINERSNVLNEDKHWRAWPGSRPQKLLQTCDVSPYNNSCGFIIILQYYSCEKFGAELDRRDSSAART